MNATETTNIRIPEVAPATAQPEEAQHLKFVPQGIVLATGRRFEDIRITGLIEDRCQVAQPGILRIWFQLSSVPPLGWASIFNTGWQSLTYQNKPLARAEGDAIWIECAPEEVRRIHFEPLEEVTAQANASYRGLLRQKAAAAAADHQSKRIDPQTRSKLKELVESFQPKVNAPMPARRQRISCGVGVLMVVFCAIWTAFGLLPQPLARLGGFEGVLLRKYLQINDVIF